jgi:hypothetical protein
MKQSDYRRPFPRQSTLVSAPSISEGLTVCVPVNKVKNWQFEYWILIAATRNMVRVKAKPASKVILQSQPVTVACHVARIKMKLNVEPKMRYELIQVRASSRSGISRMSLTSWNFTPPEGRHRFENLSLFNGGLRLVPITR